MKNQNKIAEQRQSKKQKHTSSSRRKENTMAADFNIQEKA
jgi:hypothetical protein